MSVLNKIKAAGKTAADKIGRGVEYAKGKTSHFEHPTGINERIVKFRMDREQIPKLYDRIASLTDHSKEMADSENKLAKEFAVLGGHEQEHPVLAEYERAFGDCYAALAEQHYIFHSRLDEIKAEWKEFNTRDLSDIKVIHDKVNHALADTKYWRKNAEPSKMVASESKYRQLCTELVDMINRLKEKKEVTWPNYILSLANVSAEYYRSCLQISMNLVQRLDEIGPVIPIVGQPLNPQAFEVYDAPHTPPPAYPQEAYMPDARPVSVSAPIPPPQTASASSQLRCRGIFEFSATKPDELSFKIGEEMTVVATLDAWWLVQNNYGGKGLIPSNYVELI